MAEKSYGFEDVVLQLRAANSMLAMLLMKEDGITQRQMITQLKESDLPASEIAKVLGTTTNTVQVTISQERAKRRVLPKKAKKAKKAKKLKDESSDE